MTILIKFPFLVCPLVVFAIFLGNGSYSKVKKTQPATTTGTKAAIKNIREVLKLKIVPSFLWAIAYPFPMKTTKELPTCKI